MDSNYQEMAGSLATSQTPGKNALQFSLKSISLDHKEVLDSVQRNWGSLGQRLSTIPVCGTTRNHRKKMVVEETTRAEQDCYYIKAVTFSFL